MKKNKNHYPVLWRISKIFLIFNDSRRNKNIDFEIFTDQPVEQFSLLNARNIHFNRVTFSDFKRKFNQNLTLKFR